MTLHFTTMIYYYALRRPQLLPLLPPRRLLPLLLVLVYYIYINNVELFVVLWSFGVILLLILLCLVPPFWGEVSTFDRTGKFSVTSPPVWSGEHMGNMVTRQCRAMPCRWPWCTLEGVYLCGLGDWDHTHGLPGCVGMMTDSPVSVTPDFAAFLWV